MNVIAEHQYLATTNIHGGMLETVLDHTPVPVAVSRLTDNQLLYVNKECREMFADGAVDRAAGS